jgi:phage tail sheath protein FI
MASSLNLGTIKTPGVYIDEMSLFPPSVAQVDTSVPAFIGPTALEYKISQPIKIASMAEYRSLYGGGPSRELTVELDARNAVKSVKPTTPAAYLFDSLQLFFANGGQKCYIVSTGTIDPDAAAYTKALDELRKYDEPTLIVMPDAVRLDETQLQTVQQAALSHCHQLQDRFAILDVQMALTDQPPSSQAIKDTIDAFRGDIGNDYLNYGAAYYPYLQTTLPLTVSYRNLTLQQEGGSTISVATLLGTADTELTATITALNGLKGDRVLVSAGIPKNVDFSSAANATIPAKLTFVKSKLTSFATISPTVLGDSFDDYNASPSYTKLIADIDHALADSNSTLALAQDFLAKAQSFTAGFVEQIDSMLQAREADLIRRSPIYANIVKAVANQGIVLPPSGAVAGAYARTDSDRGVWKSPANVSLNYVAGPAVALTDAEQDDLNVDPIAGKSINAIRAFTGKGTLVWGGRTLAGSDNEWRYISVRRFFLMAEESIKKATAQFVFEANDANTWVRVRAMVENFLTLQWRAGALAGNKADNAYFVRVGLGQTMTPQDVLNGLMIVEIGMAVVRPAEFIVLRFSHKMQEA